MYNHNIITRAEDAGMPIKQQWRRGKTTGSRRALAQNFPLFWFFSLCRKRKWVLDSQDETLGLEVYEDFLHKQEGFQGQNST